MSARVYYEKTQIYEQLVDEHSVFDSYLDFFMFAAALGYYEQRRVMNADGDNEMLWMHVSNTEHYMTIAQSIAFQETGDTEILSDSQAQLEILRDYAAGGAEIMAERFEGNDPTVDVVEFLLEEGAPLDDETESGLGGVL